MRISDLALDQKTTAELAALSQFLLSRAEERDAKKTISLNGFIKLARDMGISLTADQLINLSQRPPLSNLIQDVQNDKVVFRGSDEPEEKTMSVDKARDVVDKMAKRASGI